MPARHVHTIDHMLGAVVAPRLHHEQESVRGIEHARSTHCCPQLERVWIRERLPEAGDRPDAECAVACSRGACDVNSAGKQNQNAHLALHQCARAMCRACPDRAAAPRFRAAPAFCVDSANSSQERLARTATMPDLVCVREKATLPFAALYTPLITKSPCVSLPDAESQGLCEWSGHLCP